MRHYALAQVGHAAFSTAIPDYDFLYRQVLYGFRLNPGHVDELFDEEEPCSEGGLLTRTRPQETCIPRLFHQE